MFCVSLMISICVLNVFCRSDDFHLCPECFVSDEFHLCPECFVSDDFYCLQNILCQSDEFHLCPECFVSDEFHLGQGREEAAVVGRWGGGGGGGRGTQNTARTFI